LRKDFLAGAQSQESMMSQQELLRQLDAIMQRIRRACARCGRDPREVRLLLATKTVPAERILFALQAGQTLIGENKVQEIRTSLKRCRAFRTKRTSSVICKPIKSKIF